MGASFGKLLKAHFEPKVVNVTGNISEDPRSPTEGVERTPIAMEKKPYLETDIDNVTSSLPLRVKLLRKTIDPRSPTAGINRTPIALLQSPMGPQEFESPVSLYSNYQTEVESFSCLPSPAEPSVNVSDFEERFSQELDNLVEELEKSSGADSPLSTSPNTALSANPKPATSTKEKIENRKMCESLIQEIIDSFKEYEDEIKTKSQPKRAQNKLTLAPAPTKTNSTPKFKKTRKPLSNITSAGNTPIKLHLRKEEKLIKVEMSGENSPLANVRAQWDHDSTVII